MIGITFRPWRILALLAICALSAAAFAQKLTFTYNPPNGTSFVMTKTVTMTESTNDKQNAMKQITKTRVDIAKTKSGFTLTFTPISATQSVNGKEQKVPDSPEMHAKLVYVLDAKGKLVKVQGLEDLFNKIMATMPAEVKKQNNAAKFVEAQTKARKEEWAEVMGRYLGKTASIGDVWNIPGDAKKGPMSPMKSTLKFVKMTNVGKKQVVQVRYTPTYNSAAIKAAAEANFAQMKARAAQQQKTVDIPTIQSALVTGEIVRLIEPTTMLTYSEVSTRTMNVVLKSKEKGTVRMKTIEKQEMKYEFKK